ncbi:hypothetical protein BST95_19405 (plasmid) [Halioglobus japonicus]|uniref:Class I SAM-dependent methyltransferase n=1 Tax=Halioglobus japonicus TaxID=930805 RepID=A0AAP8SLN2_9GAMM|nr:class I SAM-dependent methyltransferase [Halioglobus japonicus]AQA20059.1 hypothetical protein BST95_19250 [Halioglobus japonicus]AQA20413.1 hypothetical protein BST95_19405 [Halioglobus japonicus]PLW84719.1 class I SAM-dependent methyltransferase [Halioglobus japonicus]GHD21056.1 hypothetical protein GCM10007052_31420 [Halioglobus japonicus]
MSFNKSYLGERQDIIGCIPVSTTRMLDIGCSVGALGRAAKTAVPGLYVHGIDYDADMAAVATEHLDEVTVADMDSFALAEGFPNASFDCVVMADVLEHLRDPWKVVRDVTEVAADGATVIACVPNVRHIDTLFNLVFRQRWPYRERGIHDRTHLRFFARGNLPGLMAQNGLEIVTVRTNYRLVERPSRLNRFARFLALPGLRGFLAFQYIVVARRLPRVAS